MVGDGLARIPRYAIHRGEQNAPVIGEVLKQLQLPAEQKNRRRLSRAQVLATEIDHGRSLCADIKPSASEGTFHG
jgi:hypothetical protein